MALPTPSLDDRGFQDLVDDAKRRLQQMVPAWSDHNVHDPGVTLIELTAWMTDQLLYRLGRLPDNLRRAFLDLIGVDLLAPSSARVLQTFRLSAPPENPVTIPAGTQVATPRVGSSDPIVFETVEDVTVVPATLAATRSVLTDGSDLPHRDALLKGEGFHCFSAVPVTDEALLIGASEALPSHLVLLQLQCQVEGIGVDPRDPPLTWEARCGNDWLPCDVEEDSTGGLNRPGSVTLHLPPGHTVGVIGGERAGWLRARVTADKDGQPRYSSSPRITSIDLMPIGASVVAVNGELVRNEVLGTCEGGPSATFSVQRPPIVAPLGDAVVEVSTAEGWQPWSSVDDFAASGPDDLHVVIDPVGGQVRFGPATREPDGALRQHGAVPGAGMTVRLASYRSGGGARGNVGERNLTVLRSSVPFVSETANRRPARGGRDAETVAEAVVRAPLQLGAAGRAVTARDIEVLALSAAREVARVRALPDTTVPGGVRILIVPVLTERNDPPGKIAFGDLVPDDATLQRVAAALDERRVLGTRLLVEPPRYQGITVVARLQCAPLADPTIVQRAAVAALYAHFHPVSGGPTGEGWPFGRTVNIGEVYGVLQRVAGVDLVEDTRLFPADPVSGDRGDAVQAIALDPHALVFGYEHQVRVTVGS